MAPAEADLIMNEREKNPAGETAFASITSSLSSTTTASSLAAASSIRDWRTVQFLRIMGGTRNVSEISAFPQERQVSQYDQYPKVRIPFVG